MEATAKLKNAPTPPRKMRLVANLIRGRKVNEALNILRFEPKKGADFLEKLLLSAIANWQNKNEDERLEEADLYIKNIFVDGGRVLKRIRPAPQGRAHRVRKRFNHVTLIVDSSNATGEEAEASTAKEEEETNKTQKSED